MHTGGVWIHRVEMGSGTRCFYGFRRVQLLIDYANEGISFIFGPLLKVGDSPAFALSVLPVIIFFSALIAVLYHLKIMQLIFRVIGGGLSKLLGTSQTESLAAAANIFVGQSESPLVIKPLIAGLTRSELFTIMTSGLSAVAGSTLFGYALLGIPIEYLLAASFMAAPAGLVFGKLIIPETEKPQTVKTILKWMKAKAQPMSLTQLQRERQQVCKLP